MIFTFDLEMSLWVNHDAYHCYLLYKNDKPVEIINTVEQVVGLTFLLWGQVNPVSDWRELSKFGNGHQKHDSYDTCIKYQDFQRKPQDFRMLQEFFVISTMAKLIEPTLVSVIWRSLVPQHECL
jgi:hypothetical protein